MSADRAQVRVRSLAYMFLIVVISGLVIAWFYSMLQAPLYFVWDTTLYNPSNADAQNLADWTRLSFQWFPFLFVVAALFAVFIVGRSSNR